jgi:GntR family transcriptional regulator
MWDHDRPIYRQIADRLRRRVDSGELAAGDRLPAESVLAEQMGVALGTMRQALAVLREEGRIASVHGRGTFVLGTARGRVSLRGGAGADAGHGTSTDAEDTGTAEDQIAARLRVPAGTPVMIRTRQVVLEGRTVQVARTYSLADPVAAASARATEEVTARAAGDTDSGTLGLAPGSPVLDVVRTAFAEDGSPVEVTDLVFAGDAYRLVYDVAR